MLSNLRQSKEWARFLASQGWIVEEVGGTKAYIRKLPVYGSVIKIQRPPKVPPVEAIDKLAQKHRALFVKVEPLSTANYELSTSHGFIHDSSPNLPTKTIIIDLTKSEEELWQNLSQDARQSIRKAKSDQLLVISYRYGENKFAEALKEFHQLLKRTGRRQRFWTPSLDQLKTKLEYFGKNAVLFLAYSPMPDQPIAGRLRRPASPRGEASPLAGAFNLIHDRISYGCYAASSTKGREFHAPYLLIWEIIKKGKDSKLRALDLEGIYDPRYHKLTKSWQGFTVFKRKFGGKEEEYPPPLVKYYHPLVRLLFKVGSLFD